VQIFWGVNLGKERSRIRRRKMVNGLQKKGNEVKEERNKEGCECRKE
jgi:hypothetical protein